MARGWSAQASGAPPAPSPTDPPPTTPSSTAAAPAHGGPLRDEWMAGAGGAWSVDFLQGDGGRRYVPVTVSWAREVTRDRGPGLLRGRFAWGVEVMPVYWQRRPTTTVGVGVVPLVWRWRFVTRGPVTPFAELAFGGLFTRDPVPEDTETANFLAHGGFGLRWRPARRLGAAVAYRFQHISNGNQRRTNPGVNAHVIWLGVSILRAR